MLLLEQIGVSTKFHGSEFYEQKSSKINYYICYNKYKILGKHRKSGNHERYNR
ncbi:hypothetical protein psyc5s11_18960 [Clostridium gelidum]|uniref:Uncharacterized protein n=1 Tax=Clostridium gelidum TaxID=704125 RepID=A0ABN6IUV4_9CLOT|nr:hypothetical protein psyc5s11_18960 [Clostridium gelidum]